MIVERTHKDQTITEGDAAHRRAISNRRRRQFVEVMPEEFARHGIEREEAIVGTDQIHYTVNYQRRGIEAAFDLAGLKSPDGRKLFDVLARDLVERAVTL